MSDETLPPPLPNDDSAIEPPPRPVSSSGVALGEFALLGGLAFLVPGGLCSIMAIGMLAGKGEEAQIAWVVGGLGVPAVAVGIGLLIFGWRRLSRTSG